MPQTTIQVEGLYKEYILGTIGHGSLHQDLSSWWARLRGQTDPNSIIGRSTVDPDHQNHYLALRDVSFDVKQGEALGIIGQNGAGKSTLLKIISRITAPTAGTVKLKGKVSSLLEVGTGFHMELSGRENIYLNGAILGMNRATTTKRLDEIIAFAGMETFIDTPVKRYSSGMYVRLAFSVAAHLDADILILDEVLAMGDIDFQKKCLGKMNDVAVGQGRTVLFVSHNMGLVSGLCPRTLCLNQGQVVEIGETSAVINRYMATGADQNSRLNLTDWRENRTTTGDARFTGVTLTDETGAAKNRFVSQETIRTTLTLTGPTDTPFCIEVSILDNMGRCIIDLFSSNDAFSPSFTPGTTTVDLRFNCPLTDGTYYMSLWLGDRHRMPLDEIRSCIAFSVYDTNRVVPSRGVVHQPAKWSQEGEPHSPAPSPASGLVNLVKSPNPPAPFPKRKGE